MHPVERCRAGVDGHANHSFMFLRAARTRPVPTFQNAAVSATAAFSRRARIRHTDVMRYRHRICAAALIRARPSPTPKMGSRQWPLSGLAGVLVEDRGVALAPAFGMTKLNCLLCVVLLSLWTNACGGNGDEAQGDVTTSAAAVETSGPVTEVQQPPSPPLKRRNRRARTSAFDRQPVGVCRPARAAVAWRRGWHPHAATPLIPDNIRRRPLVVVEMPGPRCRVAGAGPSLGLRHTLARGRQHIVTFARYCERRWGMTAVAGGET